MTQRAVTRHLGEDGTLDGQPARFVTLNPPESLDVGETEYHGQQRRFAVIGSDAPPFGVGSLVALRGALFEVTAVVSDGEGMRELIVRERDPAAVDAVTIARLMSTAVTDGAPEPLGPPLTLLAWLAEHATSDEPMPVGMGSYQLVRWLSRHVVTRGA
jgi:hypothetical protein